MAKSKRYTKKKNYIKKKNYTKKKLIRELKNMDMHTRKRKLIKKESKKVEYNA